MKILVAIFAFIALSVSAFAVDATPLTLTVSVQHEAFTCWIDGNPAYGSHTYGDDANITNTFTAKTSIVYDHTPLVYLWTLTKSSAAWTGQTDRTQMTYDVNWKTPDYLTPGETFEAQLDLSVDYLY